MVQKSTRPYIYKICTILFSLKWKEAMKKNAGHAFAYSIFFSAEYLRFNENPKGAIKIAPTVFKSFKRNYGYALHDFHSWMTIFSTRRMDKFYEYTV